MTTAPHLVFVVPGSLETRTGGYGYDRRIIEGLRHRGWRVDVRELDGEFPTPNAEARDQAASLFAAIPEGALTLVDGLAFGALPEEVGRERQRLRFVALVHHPLAEETGLSAPMARALAASERQALAAARLAVVTSRVTARALDHYGVPARRIVVVEPGTDPAPIARGSGHLDPQLLCAASVIPRKGHETLVRAVATLTDRPWHLTCAGSLDRDRSTVERVRQLIQDFDLQDRISLVGELDERGMAEAYDRSDMFVLPTLHEGYGMAVAEALARGIPVISTASGAIPDLVGEDAGLLVPPNDPEALAGVLSDVMDDAWLHAELVAGAHRARLRLPTWAHAADRMAAALGRAAADA